MRNTEGSAALKLNLLTANTADGDFLHFFLPRLNFAYGKRLKIEPAAEAAALFRTEAGGGLGRLPAIRTL